MFKRVFLIQPPSSNILGAARPPTGLGYLAQSLLEAGIECEVRDMRIDNRLSELQKSIQVFQPDLIGVSLFSYEYKRSFGMIHHIKTQFSQIPIVVGGPHITILKQAALDACPEIDLGVAGDGELPLVQLCRGEIPYEEVPGLLYRHNGTVLSGRPTQPVLDLNRIPFPRYVRFDLSKYAREMALITSRGCPYRCIFCPNSLMRHKFVSRNAPNVVDEIEYWYTRGIKQFNIDDDNFTLNRERVYEICDEIERRNLDGLFMRCANGIRADRVDRNLLARMREVGFAEVGIGADGGNNRVLLDIVHKGETIESIEQSIRDAIDVGLGVKLFVILGNPGETMSDIEDSFALMQRYPIRRLQVGLPIPYPGTELFEYIQANNRFLIPPEEYLNSVSDNEGDVPVFDTPELPAQVRSQLIKRARKIQKAVTRRTVERMFGDVPVLPTIVGWVFASKFGQRIFFNNMLIRSIINRIWYKKAVVSNIRSGTETCKDV